MKKFILLVLVLVSVGKIRENQTLISNKQSKQTEGVSAELGLIAR